MLFIDDRKGSKELQPKISKHIPTTLTRLEYGDAYFFGKGPKDTIVPVGMERKTITDLIQSISTGRLSGHQLLGLLQTYQHVYLLVEGLWRTDYKTGLLMGYKGKKWQPLSLGKQRFTGKSINNYLNRLAVAYGIHVITTSSLAQSGNWLSNIYDWWNKEFEKHHIEFGFYTPPLSREDSRQYVTFESPPFLQRVIKEFAGVGWKKSGDLAKRFNSLFEFVFVTEEDLMKTKGIGKKLSANIIKEIGR
jgi:ERCC4-type nuclease